MIRVRAVGTEELRPDWVSISAVHGRGMEVLTYRGN
jgi:hypothetical protein